VVSFKKSSAQGPGQNSAFRGFYPKTGQNRWLIQAHARHQCTESQAKVNADFLGLSLRCRAGLFAPNPQALRSLRLPGFPRQSLSLGSSYCIWPSTKKGPEGPLSFL
jgi:hypothetical protein